MNTLVIISIILLGLIIYYLVNRFNPNTEIDKSLYSKTKSQLLDKVDNTNSIEAKTNIKVKDNKNTQNKNWKIADKFAGVIIIIGIVYYIATTLETETIILVLSLILIVFSYIHLLAEKEKHIVAFNKILISCINKILHKIGFGENVLNEDNNWEIKFMLILLYGIPIYFFILVLVRMVLSLIIYLLNIWYFILSILALYFLYMLWQNSKYMISKILFTIGIILLFIYLYEYKNLFKFLLNYAINFDEYNN
jgi:hypothetical protein